MIFFFFFKQKTAYEMRISDWSSDVCSSDLIGEHRRGLADRGHVADERRGDAPVGPYLHLRRQFGIAPDEDVELVERADDVLLAGYLLLGDEGRRRQLRPIAPRAPRQRQCERGEIGRAHV